MEAVEIVNALVNVKLPSSPDTDQAQNESNKL